jgi:hypothetical protein
MQLFLDTVVVYSYPHFMDANLHISLPPSIGKWIKQESKKQGYATPDAFILEMVQREELLSRREEIDAILLEAISSGEATPITPKFWADIRTKGRRLARSRRK